MAELKFFCIGSQKCGTTWLRNMLKMHPEIDFYHRGEIHFWDRHEISEYNAYKKIISEVNGSLTGDITPAYCTLGKDRISEIHNVLPRAKVIFIIRDPIERSWSACLQRARKWFDYSTIEDIPSSYFQFCFTHPNYILRSDYTPIVKKWSAVYGENFKVFSFDALSEDPGRFLQSIYNFLEIDCDVEKMYENYDLSIKINHKSDLIMPSYIREMLVDIYYPYIMRVNSILPGITSGWVRKYDYKPKSLYKSPSAVLKLFKDND